MAYDVIRINDKEYVVSEPPVGFTDPTLPPAFRQTGVAQRGQAIDMPRLVFNNWADRGIGIDDMPPWEHGDNMGAMRDASGVDTRHRGVLTQGHRAQSVTVPDPFSVNEDNSVLDGGWVTYNGALYGLFKDRGGTGNDQGVGVATYSGSGDSYSALTAVLQVSGEIDDVSAIAIAMHKGEPWALIAHEAGDAGSTLEDDEYDIYRLTSGSWTAASGTGFPDDTEYLSHATAVAAPTGNGYPLGVLVDGATDARHDLVAAFLEEAAAAEGSLDQTRIYYTADQGTNWTNLGNVSGKPRGKANWYDPYGATRDRLPFVGTTENVYVCDIANSVAKPMLPDGYLSGTDAGFMATGGRYLFVSLQNGDIIQFSIEAGVLRDVNIGPITQVPAGGRGVVADKVGPVSAMVASSKFLYVAFKGATYSHILCYNWENGTWHPFYEAGNTNRITHMALSAEDDDIPRLHIAVDAGTTTTLLQFEYPDESAAKRTLETTASGTVDIAKIDLGDPHENGMFVRSRLAAGNLGTTSEEYVQHKFGVDAAAYTDVTPGNYIGTDPELQYGRTTQNTGGADTGDPTGVTGKHLKPRLILNRRSGTTTQTVQILDWEVEARNIYDTRLGWQVRINLEETARKPWARSVETVIDELRTIISSGTLVPYEWGRSGKKYVFHRGQSVMTSQADLESLIASARTSGEFQLTIVEGIPSS